ncbi:MAG TPA: hypothetical protein HA255_01825 [Methanosphaera sp.]|nr:hypothetical protein [Methanosphaera sp.]
MKIGKSLLISLVGILLIISISSVSAGLFDSISDAAGGNSDLTVENITLTDDGYGMYKVNCDMIPKKDFSYLEMEVTFYDNNGAVVGKSPLVWNMNEVKEGQLIKVTGNAYLDSSSNTPATAEIFIIDTAFGDSDNPIFAENVTMS